MKKKKQHIIPACYLKSWDDPDTPANQEPYIWIISNDGSTKRKKSPRKIFTETDMYTIKFPDGKRDLVIEDTLSRIEDAFTRIVRDKINNHLPLTNKEHAELCTFVAAMSVRTKSQQQNFENQYSELHNMVVAMEEFHNAPPRTSIETKILRDYAHQITISKILKIMPQMLYQMSMSFFESDDDLGFITSDSPCVWFNPEAYKWPPLYRSPGLGQKHTEVTLPVTPRHLLYISWNEITGYKPSPIALTDEFNRRTRGYCDKYFVCRRDYTKAIWFECGKIPDDAWEKQQLKGKTN